MHISVATPNFHFSFVKQFRSNCELWIIQNAVSLFSAVWIISCVKMRSKLRTRNERKQNKTNGWKYFQLSLFSFDTKIVQIAKLDHNNYNFRQPARLIWLCNDFINWLINKTNRQILFFCGGKLFVNNSQISFACFISNTASYIVRIRNQSSVIKRRSNDAEKLVRIKKWILRNNWE